MKSEKNKPLSIRRRFRQPLEFTAAWLAFSIFPFLSRKMILGLSRVLGDAAYRFSRRDRAIALANLTIVYGSTMPDDKKAAIARHSFRTIALTILDLFWFSRHTEKRIRQYSDMHNAVGEVARHSPAICLTAHFGNWELLGRASAIEGYPVTSVAAPLSNAAADHLFHRLRTDTGQRIVPREGALRKLLMALRNNERVALLIDQNTRLSNGGIFVDFFGLPTPVSPAVATLALKTASNILFMCCIADEKGYYRDIGLTVFNVAKYKTQGTPDEQIRRLTEDLVHTMENLIHEYPGYWLWMYKRWQFRAPWRKQEEYPFYAGEISPDDRKVLDRASPPEQLKS